jgi:hypothetical protein
MRAGRSLLFSMALLVLALLGAWRGSDRAAAASASAPSIALQPTTPCVSQEVQAGGAPQTVHHAGLVIVFPEGRNETRCVEFSEDSISGTQLLQESGLTIVFSSFGGGLGAGVCRIDDVGCSDPGNCFCQCQGASCAFWSYFKLDGSTWRYESVGPATRRLHDGDTDAWVWGSGHAGPGDARAACPATPTPAVPTPSVFAASTPVSPSDGPDVPTVRPAAVTEKTSVPTMTQSTSTPLPRGTPKASTQATPFAHSTGLSTGARPGGGAPAGLIAFGVSAGVLGAVIGGIFLRRRLGG